MFRLLLFPIPSPGLTLLLSFYQDTLAPSRLPVVEFHSEIAKGAAWGGHLNLLKKMDSANELFSVSRHNDYMLCRSAAGGGQFHSLDFRGSRLHSRIADNHLPHRQNFAQRR